MGYRSDVEVVIYETDWANIKAEALINGVDVIPPTEERKSSCEGRPALLRINFKHIKWYDGYEEVKFLMEQFSQLADQNTNFAFIRVGEDPTDIETMSGGEFYLYPTVHIEEELGSEGEHYGYWDR